MLDSVVMVSVKTVCSDARQRGPRAIGSVRRAFWLSAPSRRSGAHRDEGRDENPGYDVTRSLVGSAGRRHARRIQRRTRRRLRRGL